MDQSLGPGTAPGPSAPHLDDYSSFVRRHTVLILLAIVAGVLGGVAWEMSSPRYYSATASVLLAPIPTRVDTDPSGRAPDDVTIDTDAQLVLSWPVVMQVANEVGQPTQSVADNLRVSAPPLTRVIRVSFTTTDPDRARLGAQRAAEAFIATRGDTLAAVQADQLKEIRLRLTMLAGALESSGDDRETRRNLQAQADALRTQLQSIIQAKAAPGQILHAANRPQNADKSNAEVSLASGGMLGATLAILVGWLMDRVQRRRSATSSSTSAAKRRTAAWTPPPPGEGST